MQEKSAGVVIVNNEKYLLLHYDAGHWDLPKGHVEKGETDEQTALRELKEETGITDAIILPGFIERIHYFFKKEGRLVSKEVVFFMARTNTTNIILSHEHKDFIWLPFKEAVERLTHNNSKEVLKKADAFVKHVKE